MILSGQKDAARAYLAEAKRWIDRGWKVHAGESAELTALRANKPAQAVTGTLAASAINPTPKRPLVATVWLIIPNQRPAPIAWPTHIGLAKTIAGMRRRHEGAIDPFATKLLTASRFFSRIISPATGMAAGAISRARRALLRGGPYDCVFHVRCGALRRAGL